MADPLLVSVNGQDQIAIQGTSEIGWGVAGKANKGTGIVGTSQTWVGVYGESAAYHGVEGVATAEGQPGVAGIAKGKAGMGVYGTGEQGPGMIGTSKSWHGMYGESESTTGGAGVWGEHKGGGSGVVGVSHSGAGVYGKGGRVAGFFEGDVEVTGDVRLTNADCAEDFDIADGSAVEPGTVMVLSEEGSLKPSDRAYDKRVAGVVSGAGGYKPAIVLDKQPASRNRLPIALLGKVFCKVDADAAAVDVGDLLTTSETPGHAMKAGDQAKAFGSVIGKALRPLPGGRGVIPILIALQ
jgi:hypothetical protein